MVATLAQAASAEYYLESQRSFRHPNEYYTAGEEPDGVWFNPNGLFGLEDGGKVDSGHFHRLYHGFAPDGSGRLTRNAGSEKRSPGLDMTFSADKSVSALWALADPELRVRIERAHNDAARVALEETVFRHCGFTRIRDRQGKIHVLPADLMTAMFQHGTSRENDPQLHTHCVIFNAARAQEDGKWRAMHQHPVYGWAKAAGAVYRNALAWNLHRDLGLPIERYGRDGEFTRIVGVPEDLAAHWSKRRAAIIDAANDMGFKVEGNAARAAAANKITRAGKSPDNDPEVRHRRWRGEAEGFVEREELITSLKGEAEDITREQLRELTEALEALPEKLTREEAVFRLPDIVERVGNVTAGLMGRDAVTTSIERVLRHPEVVRLTRIPRSAEGRADMAHTRLYSTGRTLQMERALREMATDMAAETAHGLTVSRGTEDDRTASPLEIAVGDRLRIGATHWEKRLFNGTVVTVEDLRVERHGAGTEAGDQGTAEARDRSAGDPFVEITARTDDGREVRFRHDEIRDWYGNVRLDHGYALTIAAAQGLTVDRSFLLADDRPARETIYPAGTRHREAIDVYVSRAPPALDVADRRADSDRDAPVTDAEIRAHLAERWSRSVPKEAALDYTADGKWEELAEGARERGQAAGVGRQRGAGETYMEESRSAANDNALSRIARDVQRTAFAWRHGAAVDAFAAGRQEVVAAWDELRERSRAEGDVVALGDPYRETLDRHAALLRQAEPFRAHPEAFASLLAERARIGRGDLEEFETLHERARRHRRAATMRQTHRARRETERQASQTETRENVRPAHQEAVEAASLVPPGYLESVPPPTDEDHAEAARKAPEELAPPAPEPPKPDWLSAWDPVMGAWNALIDRARQSGAVAFYMKGYSELIPRIRELMENPDIPADRRESLVPLLENHERRVKARKRVDDFLEAAKRHRHRRNAIKESANETGVAVTQTPNYGQWRGTADRLLREGKAILADRSCGHHLDRVSSVRRLAEDRVSDLGEAIREDDQELAEARREEHERQRLSRELAFFRFAADIGVAVQPDPAPAAAADGTQADRLLWRLRQVYDWDGRLAESDRQARIEVETQASLERWRALREEWNRLVDRAEKEGVHVIDTGDYHLLRSELKTAARDDPYLPEEVRSEIDSLIRALGAAERARDRVVDRSAALADRLARRREMPNSEWSRDERAFVDRQGYDPWRRDTEKAVEAAERVLADRMRYGVHLQGLTLLGIQSALTHAREVLAEDDRHMAEALVPERKGDDPRRREERIAQLLDDPEKLRELHRRQIERKEARKAARRQRRKGRYQVRSMRM